MSASPEVRLDRAMEVRVKDRVYFVPLKESKQTISLRVLPKALQIIDRFAVLHGDITRTKLIEGAVVSMAAAIQSARYRVKSIVVVVVDEDDELHFGAVVFNPDEKSLNDIRKRLYRALLG